MPNEASLKTPTSAPFHGAQATYILRTNEIIRNKWLRIFPDRYKVVESILINIDQHYRKYASISSANAISSSDSEKGEEVVKGKRETEVAPKGAGDSHRAEGDGVTISAWRSVKGWSLTPDEELEMVARLKAEFPELDLLGESQTWAARKLSEPLKLNSKPSQQIWNWMRKGRQFAQERREHEQGEGQRVKVHSREAYRGPW